MSFLRKGSKDKEEPKGPRTTDVILVPPADCRPAAPPTLKPGDEEKLQEIVQHVAQHRQAHPCDPSYAPFEETWLRDRNVYHRYLRATRGDVKSSKRRIIVRALRLTQDTLEWRREFKPELIPPDEVAPEAETGKHVLTGFDKEGRPILYLRPGRENTKTSPRQIRYMVWSLERGIDLMPPGQETLTIVVDFNGANLSTMPSLSTARHVAHILQTHYVERLGRAFVCHMPKFISAFFSALSPFLDPVTKDKIRFNQPDMTEFVRPDQLDDQFPGGQYPYQFDFAVYWPALVKACGIQPDGSRIPPQP
ncbi:4-nitrophenylphosphatase [Malassezia obtusa]|uniref:4-nitrophenylphosphatase n=1 Tax=Malassezia obtusa TaxID=76774 RepID=A0AAF0E2G3_9BASI|nr:4-nitrophenylphosphatase [Malassezia obtusa]